MRLFSLVWTLALTLPFLHQFLKYLLQSHYQRWANKIQWQWPIFLMLLGNAYQVLSERPKVIWEGMGKSAFTNRLKLKRSSSFQSLQNPATLTESMLHHVSLPSLKSLVRLYLTSTADWLSISAPTVPKSLCHNHVYRNGKPMQLMQK